MSYEIKFKEKALTAFNKLDDNIKLSFLNKLDELKSNPKIPKNKLRGKHLKDCYKIKLKTVGYRLIYQVKDSELIILVLKVGKRENNDIYKDIENLLNNH